MADPLFCVDLSNDARDYRHMATEPGLGMLDRTGSNYAIMERWFGNLVAEPEWRGKDRVFFFVNTADGARMDDIECYPATKEDLEGPLNDPVKAIGARLKKARPEGATEQTLHRLARKTYNGLTADFEQGEHEHYFFKYREGRQPWQLAWCWGYQRTDQEPATSVICSNAECQQLLVKRPKQKEKCPNCETYNAGRKRPAFMGFSSRTLGIGLLLLLLLFLGGLLLISRPRLVVSPASTTVAQGRKIEYKVLRKSWLIFSSDVTEQAVPSSSDSRVITFPPAGPTAKAMAPGRASLMFDVGGMSAQATVVVTTPDPPKSITIEPANIKLAVGSTAEVKVMGHYDGEEPIDFTQQATFIIEDDAIAHAKAGLFEGSAPGNTIVRATLLVDAGKEESIEATAKINVAEGVYKSLEVKVDPEKVALGQKAEIIVTAKDAKGNEYNVTTNSRLKLLATPVDSVKLMGGYLMGRKSGETTLAATLGDAKGNLKFTVTTESVLGDGLIVSPADVTMNVNEWLPLEVTSLSDEPISMKSANPEIATRYLDTMRIVGRKAGKTTLTVTQGKNSKEITITVKDHKVASVELIPSRTTLRVGETEAVKVVATLEDDRRFEIVPDAINWSQQPPAQYVRFNRDMLQMTGVNFTPQEQAIIASTVGDFPLFGYVSVSPAVTALAGDPLENFTFGVHPPVQLGAGMQYLRGGAYLGDNALRIGRDGLVVGDDLGAGSALVRAGLKPGMVITDVDGYSLAGLTPAEIQEYFRTHPFRDGTRISYVDADGNTIRYTFGGSSGVFVQPVRLVEVQPKNLTAIDFNAEMHLQLREKAEYRLTDSAGEELAGWNVLGPRQNATITTSKIRRIANDEYSVTVERRIGSNVKRYPISFNLVTEE